MWFEAVTIKSSFSSLSRFCLPIDIFSCLHTCVYTCPRTVPACLHVPKSDLQTRSTSEWMSWNLSSWLQSISGGHVVPASTEGLQMPRRWSRLLFGLKWSMSQTASGENHGYCLCFPWCESAFLWDYTTFHGRVVLISWAPFWWVGQQVTALPLRVCLEIYSKRNLIKHEGANTTHDICLKLEKAIWFNGNLLLIINRIFRKFICLQSFPVCATLKMW